MSYAIARIDDDTFVEPLMILGVTEDHVCGLVAAYLRVARPLTAPDGKRLEVPEEAPSEGWAAWLDEVMLDVDGVTVTSWCTDRGDLMPAGAFARWVQENAESIGKQHTPLVEDVIFLDERTTL